MRFDESSAECSVFTYKEGMLSAIAHDLQISVQRFSIELDGPPGAPTALRATFDATSLRVVCAMKDGAADHHALSEGDKKKIEKNMLDDVLHPSRFPSITFTSTRIDGDRVEGTLKLHGAERPISVAAARNGDRYSAEIEINQPDFGIKPFSAALGTLKVQPRLRVRVSIPAAG